MRNPFSPYDYNEQTPGHLSLNSLRTQDDMYNSVITNGNYIADARKSFMTNDYDNQYVTQVTHAYLYRDVLQPTRNDGDKPIPQPKYAFCPARNEVWYNTTNNTVLFKSKEDPWETEDRVLDADGNKLSLISDTYNETRYKTFDGRIFNGVLTFDGDIAKFNGGVLAKASNLAEIYLPKGLELGNGFLEECINLRTVIIGPALSAIKYGVLRKCTKLHELYLMNDLTVSEDFTVAKRSSVGTYYDNEHPEGDENDPRLHYLLYVVTSDVLGLNATKYREIKGNEYPETDKYIWPDEYPIFEFNPYEPVPSDDDNENGQTNDPIGG